MVIQTHKIVRLSMDFFPYPYGNMSYKQGFQVEIPNSPPGVVGKPTELLTTIRCILSETTSHSMATESILGKLPSSFLWLDGTTKKPNPLYTPKQTRPYFFTSALGDIHEEDRQKGKPITPQLEVLGTLDLYFKVNNDSEQLPGRLGNLKKHHYFHLEEVIVVKELFPNQPALTAPGAKKFELCLGQDFFQTYPHLLFEVTPTPGFEILISSIHADFSPTVFTHENGALCIYAAGLCSAKQEPETDEVSVQCGYGVYFSPNSVYNTFHHLPEIRPDIGDQGFHKDGAASGSGGGPPETVPNMERAALASLVMAMEMAISLHRLGNHFRGVNVYHNSNHFERSKREERAAKMKAGLIVPNIDLIHRLFHLQAMIEDPKRCNLGKVELIASTTEKLRPAMLLAGLGSGMRVFTGPMMYSERIIAFGCEHPAEAPSGIQTPNLPGPAFDVIERNSPHQGDQQSELEDLQMASPSPSDTLGRSRCESLEGKIVKRVPMFLNFGNTITYTSKGKIISYTPRRLFLLDKKEARARLCEVWGGTSGVAPGAECSTGERTTVVQAGEMIDAMLPPTINVPKTKAETFLRSYRASSSSQILKDLENKANAESDDKATTWLNKEFDGLQVNKLDRETPPKTKGDVMKVIERPEAYQGMCDPEISNPGGEFLAVQLEGNKGKVKGIHKMNRGVGPNAGDCKGQGYER